jgi:AraC-like DNA-binding protein
MKQNQIIQSDRRNGFSSSAVLPGSGRLDGFLPGGKCEKTQKVERSLVYMAENLNKPLQVSTLAAQVNLSPSHFFALFKQMTGHPPIDYFTKLRMRHACWLLDSTTARVKEVAAALGYDDPFYFSRVFKSVSAVAPVHYRSLELAVRREIKELLEPKDQVANGDPLRRIEPGRMAARGSSIQTRPTQQNPQNHPPLIQQKRVPSTSQTKQPTATMKTRYKSDTQTALMAAVNTAVAPNLLTY